MYLTRIVSVILTFNFFLAAHSCHAELSVDLSTTVLVSPVGGTVGKAAAFLSDEVYDRTGIRWYIRDHFEGAARIVLCTGDTVPEGIELPKGLVIPDAAEGFALGVNGADVFVVGRKPRGVLFGVGRLLRLMTMRDGEISLPKNTMVSTSPKHAMRVHQMGYRLTATSYDLWDRRNV